MLPYVLSVAIHRRLFLDDWLNLDEYVISDARKPYGALQVSTMDKTSTSVLLK